MALRAKVIDLIGPDLLHRRRQARRIGEVRVVQVKAIADRWAKRGKVVGSLTVPAAGTANQPVPLVVGLAQEKLGEIRAVLTGNSCDERAFHAGLLPVWPFTPAVRGCDNRRVRAAEFRQEL